jgi:hypothetical protein
MNIKNAIEKRVNAKRGKREQFLKENLESLRPFLEPKVIARLETPSPTEDEDSVVSTGNVNMQPDAIQADMRDYQMEALNWMSGMYANNVNFILGDEMGLGACDRREGKNYSLEPYEWYVLPNFCFVLLSYHRQNTPDDCFDLPHQGAVWCNWSKPGSRPA